MKMRNAYNLQAIGYRSVLQHISLVCGTRSSLPRRLIDVRLSGNAIDLKLIQLDLESAVSVGGKEQQFPLEGQSSSYCALSYCWGPNKRAASPSKVNLSRQMNRIPW